MSDTPTPPPPSPAPSPAPAAVKRGLGVFGAFVTGLVAAALVLAGAVFSLPYWPEEARVLWRGAPPQLPPPPPAPPTAPAVDVAGPVNSAVDAAKRELNARLDDLEKRVRAAATTAAQADRPAINDSAIAELRTKIEALENKPPSTAPANPETDKELAALKAEVAALRDAAQRAAGGEQKALAAARASALIGIAARLSAALDQGLPFAADLGLLSSLAQGDAALGEIVTALQPLAASGVAARASLATDFPAVAKAALAQDLADDSFGQRVLGKIKAIISLRRVGADVEGETAEAKLARAEAALDAGNVAKAVDLVKTLPAQTARATATWLGRAEGHLAAQRAVDRLAAHAVALLGAARP